MDDHDRDRTTSHDRDRNSSRYTHNNSQDSRESGTKRNRFDRSYVSRHRSSSTSM
jgi:hypothetical protein